MKNFIFLQCNVFKAYTIDNIASSNNEKIMIIVAVTFAMFLLQ